MNRLLLTALLLLSAINAHATDPFKGANTVIAKYENFYKGDDDLYAQCLIVSNGKKLQRQYIFQGLQAVSEKTKTVSDLQKNLLEGMRRNLSAKSVLAPYSGYDFLVMAKTPGVVILGQAPGAKANTESDQYFSVDPTSTAASVVKAICNMESKD